MKLDINNIFKIYNTFFEEKKIKCSRWDCTFDCSDCAIGLDSKLKRLDTFLSKLPVKITFNEVIKIVKKI